MLNLALAFLQVSVSPPAMAPAGIERLAVRVANPVDAAAIVAVRVAVPEALTILGVDAPPGWTVTRIAATDSSAPALEWSGSNLDPGAFREFAFLARLGAAARPNTLVFPVRLRRADGSVREWRPGGYGQAPTVEIRSTVAVTAGGAFTLAAAAIGLAALGIALALRRPR